MRRRTLWGSDSRGIWVDRGCRAEFLIAGNGGTYRDRGRNQPLQTVVCESNGQGRCVIDRTWGSDENGVWVSNGCRAEFSMRRRL